MSSHLILGAGPVGIHIAQQVVAAGDPVGIVSRRGVTAHGATSLTADLLAPLELASQVSNVLGTVDVVYFAAQPAYTRWPEEFPALLDAAIVLAETLGAVLVAAENCYGYGPNDVALHERLALAATTRKGSTRATMSHTLFDAHAAGRIRATAGRASDFFGPDVVASVLGAPFFGPLLAGTNVPVLAAADQPHSWTYIGDFATALIQLGSDERAYGRAWHVPCVEPLTIVQMAERVATRIGRQPVEFDIMPSAAVLATAEHDEMFNEFAELLYEFEAPFIVDFSDYSATFGGAPSDVDRALAETIQWFSASAGQS